MCGCAFFPLQARGQGTAAQVTTQLQVELQVEREVTRDQAGVRGASAGGIAANASSSSSSAVAIATWCRMSNELLSGNSSRIKRTSRVESPPSPYSAWPGHAQTGVGTVPIHSCRYGSEYTRYGYDVSTRRPRTLNSKGVTYPNVRPHARAPTRGSTN